MNLLILSCSGVKRADAAQLAAMDRYDGPMWKTLRAALRRFPKALHAWQTGELEIRVLSALYGFVSAKVPIPDYDTRMTQKRLDDMRRDPSYDFQQIPLWVGDAENTLFAGGELYRSAMRRASGPIGEGVSETDAPGIGFQREQLRKWIEALYSGDGK